MPWRTHARIDAGDPLTYSAAPVMSKRRRSGTVPLRWEFRLWPCRQLDVNLLTAQIDSLAALKQRDIVSGWVFHRADGTPIKDCRRQWKNAATAAGYPHALFHDFRRSAVRTLERSGVPRSTAMAMVGHETESIYKRYAIQDEVMLREGPLDSMRTPSSRRPSQEPPTRRTAAVQAAEIRMSERSVRVGARSGLRHGTRHGRIV